MPDTSQVGGGSTTQIGGVNSPIVDSAANLVVDGAAISAITPGTDVYFLTPASLAQLAAVDAANGNGILSYHSIVGTAPDLVASIGAYVTSGKYVTIQGPATVAETNALHYATLGSGAVYVSELQDTAENLLQAGYYGRGSVNLTVTDALSLQTLAELDQPTSGTIAYNTIVDTAAHLVSGGAAHAAIHAGTNVIVVGSVSASDIGILDAANGGGTLTYDPPPAPPPPPPITGEAQHLVINNVAIDAITPGTNVTLTGWASIEQLTIIDAANGNGTLSFRGLSDTAPKLLASLGTYLVADKDVGIVNGATVAQISAIRQAIGPGGTWSVAFIGDTAENLLAARDTYVQGHISLFVTDQVSLQTLSALDQATSGNVRFATLADTAANLISGGIANSVIWRGTNVHVLGNITATEISILDAANGDGSLTSDTIPGDLSAPPPPPPPPTTQVGGSSSVQIDDSTSSQGGGLEVGDTFTMTAAQLRSIDPRALAAMTTNQLGDLTARQLTLLSSTQLNALTANSLARLSTSQVRGLSATQLGNLSTTSITALISTQLPSLGVAQLKGLSATYIAALNNTQIRSLSSGQLGGLTTTQLNAITNTSVRELTSTQLGGLTQVQIRGLSTTFFTALTATQLGELTQTQLRGLNTTGVAALSSTQIGGLSAIQLAALATTQLRAFATTVVRGLTATQLVGLAATQTNALSTEQLRALSAPMTIA